MKALLRKINRGIILSVAVILGICCYYLVLEIKAAPEKKAITALCEDFLEVYDDSYSLPEEYRDVTKIPQGYEDERMKQFEEKLKKLYVKDAPGIENWKSVFKSNLASNLNSDQYYGRFKSKFKKVDSVKLSGDEATVTATFRTEVKYYYDRKLNQFDEYDRTMKINLSLKKVNGKWLANTIATNW